MYSFLTLPSFITKVLSITFSIFGPGVGMLFKFVVVENAGPQLPKPAAAPENLSKNPSIPPKLLNRSFS